MRDSGRSANSPGLAATQPLPVSFGRHARPPGPRMSASQEPSDRLFRPRLDLGRQEARRRGRMGEPRSEGAAREASPPTREFERCAAP